MAHIHNVKKNQRFKIYLTKHLLQIRIYFFIPGGPEKYQTNNDSLIKLFTKVTNFW